MKYKILSRYPNRENDKWDSWQVGTFNCIEDANEYMERTVERYATYEKKFHLEMKAVEVSSSESRLHNVLLNNLLD